MDDLRCWFEYYEPRYATNPVEAPEQLEPQSTELESQSSDLDPAILLATEYTERQIDRKLNNLLFSVMELKVC